MRGLRTPPRLGKSALPETGRMGLERASERLAWSGNISTGHKSECYPANYTEIITRFAY